MDDIAIRVENLSKQYRLGTVGTGTISHDLNRLWAKVRGKEDPYLQVGDVNKRDIVGSSDLVWALKDINFEVKKGEVLGIIGKNGAGKSTLLKILSRVTTPSKGRITMSGRVGSLLEVGTGFHPELTGRENIFINGAILGMRKWEISERLEEIVEFSGVEKYLDTPVKRYSSGMKVRLGFSVAAHLEPEILIVDEVLAVGDLEFQRKCIGKMNDISKSTGRTILFVSHNMKSVANLCSRCLLMDEGSVIAGGDTSAIIDKYYSMATNTVSNQIEWDEKNRPQKENVQVVSAWVDPEKNYVGDKVFINLKINALETISAYTFSLHVRTLDNITIFACIASDVKLIQGESIMTFEIPKNYLTTTSYMFSVMISNRGTLVLGIRDFLGVTIRESIDDEYSKVNIGLIRPLESWTIKHTGGRS